MLFISVNGQFDHHEVDHVVSPIELGRLPTSPRVPFRTLRDPGVGEVHLRLEEVDGQVRLTCLSELGVSLQDNTVLAIGESRVVPMPCQMTIGQTLVYVELAEPEELATIELPQGIKASLIRQSLAELGPTPSVDKLTHWLEGLIVDQGTASGPVEVYEEAARAVVGLVGLERALVLLRRGEDWEIAAPRGSVRGFSRSILTQMAQQKRTYFNDAAWKSSVASLQGIEAVIASPILGRDGEVVGALYGSRSRSGNSGGPAIGELEARVVQILATHVAVRLAREELDLEASRLRHQFEQFFSADLAKALESDRGLLDGKQREVTVLFADIRGFSLISERLKEDPPGICRLVGAVMDRLTECIRAHDGVVVDYMGDGLMAMWNAPADQENHATMACRATLAMLSELPDLSSYWSETVGGPLQVGFGINTGPVVVGNTGSQSKFKYGPLGHSVNLASRVEGATKQLGVSALITGSTHAQLDKSIATRRICRARVVGIADAVDLFELHSDGGESRWREHRDKYESALDLFEAGELPAACRVLYSLLASREKDAYDVPSLDLIGRAITYLKSPSVKFDPILILKSK